MNLPVKRFFNRSSSPQVAVDLGTANIRVFVNGRGLVADQPTWEPSIRLRFSRSGIIKQKSSVEKAIRADFENERPPLHGGVIKDVAATVRTLYPLIRQAKNWNHSHLPVLAFAPSDANAEEEGALKEALQRAGASVVSLIEEPYAAVMGADMDLSSPYAQMLLDLGDGVADMVVVRAGEIVHSDSLRIVGGSICGNLREVALRHQSVLSHQEIITLIHHICSREGPSFAKARDINVSSSSRFPQVPQAAISEMTNLLDSTLNAVGDEISNFIRELPHQDAVEIIESGICLTGGGACIPGWPHRISVVTGIDVHTVPDPLHSVIWGGRKLLSTRW